MRILKSIVIFFIEKGKHRHKAERLELQSTTCGTNLKKTYTVLDVMRAMSI